MEVMQVRASRSDSYERLFHDAGVARGLLEFRRDEALRRRLLEPRLERFIGVIYRPDTELQSHYAEASLPQQFDGFIWFDATHAVTAHGLRKAAMRRLAEHGSTSKQIQAVSGHRTLSEIERYTRQVDQQRLAKAAIRLLPDKD